MTLSVLYRGPLSSCNYACGYCPFAKRTETAAELAHDRDCLERFVRWVGTRHWLDALDSATAAASCFDSQVAGVDLLFEPGFTRHAVLEVNAFGDFFPGWTDAAGRPLHAIELAAIARL